MLFYKLLMIHMILVESFAFSFATKDNVTTVEWFFIFIFNFLGFVVSLMRSVFQMCLKTKEAHSLQSAAAAIQ